MAPKLERTTLLKRNIALDVESRNLARAAIEAMADSRKRVAETRRVLVAY